MKNYSQTCRKSKHWLGIPETKLPLSDQIPIFTPMFDLNITLKAHTEPGRFEHDQVSKAPIRSLTGVQL